MTPTKLEAKARLVTSAPITDKVGKQFLGALFVHANLARFGFVKGDRIKTKAPISYEQLELAIAAIKKAGFPKSWTPERAHYGTCIGLATKDGKWPIIVQDQRIKVDPPMCTARILVYDYDTLDRKADNKASKAAYKAVAQELAKFLGVKLNEWTASPDGRWGVGYTQVPNNINMKKAESLMVPRYGKPLKTEPGRLISFKKDYGRVTVFFDKSGALSAIRCDAS